MKNILVIATIVLSGALGFAKSFTVTISGMKFNPDILQVGVGDTVVWKNDDIVPHTATSKDNFDSKMIMAGKSFKTKIKKAGQIDYACMFHPTMKGKITTK